MVEWELQTPIGNPMARHQATHHGGSEQAPDDPAPTVHPPAGVAATSPTEHGPARAVPVVYTDWLDEGVEFDILPTPQAGTLHARFELFGKASPTPYDFDE